MVNPFKKMFHPRATNQVRFKSYLDESAVTIQLNWYNVTNQEASFPMAALSNAIVVFGVKVKFRL